MFDIGSRKDVPVLILRGNKLEAVPILHPFAHGPRITPFSAQLYYCFIKQCLIKRWDPLKVFALMLSAVLTTLYSYSPIFSALSISRCVMKRTKRSAKPYEQHTPSVCFGSNQVSLSLFTMLVPSVSVSAYQVQHKPVLSVRPLLEVVATTLPQWPQNSRQPDTTDLRSRLIQWIQHDFRI